jgi:hypothetical protein
MSAVLLSRHESLFATVELRLASPLPGMLLRLPHGDLHVHADGRGAKDAVEKILVAVPGESSLLLRPASWYPEAVVTEAVTCLSVFWT